MSMFNGRTVVITGGARGIGLATARAFLRAGANVAIGDIDRDAAQSATAALDGPALAAELDVGDPRSFAEFFDRVEAELGPVDVLVNNAGIMPIGPYLDEEPAALDRLLRVNLVGCSNGMKTALPRMIERGAGHIVNVASAAGRAPVPGAISYGATKAAVISMTESARVEFAGSGVSFTCVMPSFTDTDLVSGTQGTRFIKHVSPDAVGEAIVAAVRDNRMDVFVPRQVGVMLKVQAALGRRIRDAINRRIGADRTFLEVDAGTRAAYVARIESRNDPS